MSGYSRTGSRVYATMPKAMRIKFITIASTGRRTEVSDSHMEGREGVKERVRMTNSSLNCCDWLIDHAEEDFLKALAFGFVAVAEFVEGAEFDEAAAVEDTDAVG